MRINILSHPTIVQQHHRDIVGYTYPQASEQQMMKVNYIKTLNM